MIRSSLYLAMFVILCATAKADDLVSIDSDTKTFANGVFTQTLVLSNSGDTEAVGVVITSQPYNTHKEPKIGGFDSSTEQQKLLFKPIPPHSSIIVKFTFTGADAKDWKWRYTDVYKNFAKHELYKDKSGKIISADIGAWGCTQLMPGFNDPSVSQDVPLFYPNAVNAIENGQPEDFALRIDNMVMPPGWSLASFDPAPSQIFSMSPDSFTTLHMAIDTPNLLLPGQEAEVDYTLTELDDGLDYHGVFCVDVQTPEPAAVQIAISGAGSLIGWFALAARRRARGAQRQAGTGNEASETSV
jgi:hypothetical protein